MARRFLTPVELPGAPGSPLHAATKQYVDDQISGVAGSGYATGIVPAGAVQPTITHNLNSTSVTVVVKVISTGLIVPVAAEALTVNTVRLTFGTAPIANEYDWMVLAAAPASAQVVPVPPVNLTDAATIATNASQGVHFILGAMAGDRTLGVPTLPTAGQRALWEITASAAQRILTLTTGSAGSFELTNAVPSATITIPSGKTAVIGAMYSLARSRWTGLAVAVTS